MTDHQRGMDMSNAMIEAACSATILGEDEQGRPVHLSPEEARTAITAAISAYLAITEPGKPESGVLAVKVKVKPIKNNPEDYVTVGMVQAKRRKEWLETLALSKRCADLDAAQAPEGWQMVPKQATKEMEEAAVARVRPFHDLVGYDWNAKVPRDLFRLAWPAMLSASPTLSPLPITGFFGTLTADQKERALNYRGPENHGIRDPSKPPTSWIVEKLNTYRDWRLAAHHSECDDPTWDMPHDIALVDGALDHIQALESELEKSRATALEEAAMEMERIAATTENGEVLVPVDDAFGLIIGHYIDPPGKRKRFVTGEKAAAAIRALIQEQKKDG